MSYFRPCLPRNRWRYWIVILWREEVPNRFNQIQPLNQKFRFWTVNIKPTNLLHICGHLCVSCHEQVLESLSKPVTLKFSNMGGPRLECLPTISSSFSHKLCDLLGWREGPGPGVGALFLPPPNPTVPHTFVSTHVKHPVCVPRVIEGRGGGHPEQLPDTSVLSVSIMSDVNASLTRQEEIQSDQILGRVDFSTLEYADVFTRLQTFPSAVQQKF